VPLDHEACGLMVRSEMRQKWDAS